MSVVITACHMVKFEAGLWDLHTNQNKIPFSLNEIILL